MTETQLTIDYSEAVEQTGTNNTPAEKYILFELAGRVCGVPAGSVLEVVHSLPVTSIPNSPNWLLGLSIFRGEPVAMVRPQAVVNDSAKNELVGNFKTIVFRCRADEAQLAIPVDRINEMIAIATDEGTELSGGHSVVRNGTPVLFIDPYSLIEEGKKEKAENGR